MRISPQSRAYASATRLCIELSHTPVHLIHLHSSPHLPAFRSLAVLLSLQTSAKTLGQRRLAAAHVKVKAPLLCLNSRINDRISTCTSTELLLSSPTIRHHTSLPADTLQLTSSHLGNHSPTLTTLQHQYTPWRPHTCPPLPPPNATLQACRSTSQTSRLSQHRHRLATPS